MQDANVPRFCDPDVHLGFAVFIHCRAAVAGWWLTRPQTLRPTTTEESGIAQARKGRPAEGGAILA